MRQIAMKFRTWGGKRRKAGRKQVNERKSEPHRRRARIDTHKPVHVILRVAPEIRRLRRMDAYAALRKAMLVVLARPDFRIVHVSIQANHVHLIVEADTAGALAKGMQAFQISAARKLNAEAGRTGTVFPDRYHAVVITSRRGARHALAYVLTNASHCTFLGKPVVFPTSWAESHLLRSAERVVGYQRPRFEDFRWNGPPRIAPRIDLPIRSA